MILKSIEAVTAADIQSLAAREGKELDYKRDLPGSSDAEKREFLCDVSSFANTVGGDLIYGVDEIAGVPSSFPGLSGVQQDQVKQTLENLIRDGIEPRLPNVQIRFVEINQAQSFLVIRVSQSWLAPHRVTLRGHDKFYGRNSAGKYDLDVGQLREAFLLTSDYRDKN